MAKEEQLKKAETLVPAKPCSCARSCAPGDMVDDLCKCDRDAILLPEGWAPGAEVECVEDGAHTSKDGIVVGGKYEVYQFFPHYKAVRIMGGTYWHSMRRFKLTGNTFQ